MIRLTIAAESATVSRDPRGVCVHLHPDDADLLAVVAHMRQASGMALCHLAPSPIMRDERVISGGAA